METKFNFESQIATSREQSERLLALGLKIETADCYHWQETDIYGDGNGKWHCEILSEYNKDHNEYLYNVCGVDGSDEGFFIPAWSLHCLWELLPKSIWHDNGLEKKYHPIIEYGFVNYVSECGMELFDFDCGYEVWGSMIVVIEWLIKEGYFNKEYLENGNC